LFPRSSGLGKVVAIIALVQFFHRDAVLFEKHLAAAGADLGQFMQWLVDKIEVLVVHLFEQKYVFVARAIIKGLGFHEDVSAINVPNGVNSLKHIADKGFRRSSFWAVHGSGVAFWDTRGGRHGKILAGKGFPAIISLSYFGTVGWALPIPIRDGFLLLTVPFWDKGAVRGEQDLLF
jgi:hypothetical protein